MRVASTDGCDFSHSTAVEKVLERDVLQERRQALRVEVRRCEDDVASRREAASRADGRRHAAPRSGEHHHRRMRTRPGRVIHHADQATFPYGHDANVLGDRAADNRLRRDHVSASLGGEDPRLAGCRGRAPGRPITRRRPHQPHGIGDVDAPAIVAAEFGARMPPSPDAVDADGDVLPGVQAIERDLKALVREDVRGGDRQAGGLPTESGRSNQAQRRTDPDARGMASGVSHTCPREVPWAAAYQKPAAGVRWTARSRLTDTCHGITD